MLEFFERHLPSSGLGSPFRGVPEMTSGQDFDFLVVGAGITGCTLAERLAAAGFSVLLIDRRDCLGGNCHDHADSSGVLVHSFGPHIFHTSDVGVVEYLGNFTDWHAYEHRVQALVQGKLVPVPYNLDTLRALLPGPEADHVESMLVSRFGRDAQVSVHELLVGGELSGFGRHVYESVFEGYSRKMWGIEPRLLDPAVMGRVPVRLSHDDRYFLDDFQALPSDGYTAMFERMVGGNELIEVRLATEHTARLEALARHTVFTGAIDAYFGYKLGRLPYRSIEFVFESRTAHEPIQPVGTINYPNDFAFTRSTEFRIMTGQEANSTTLCFEFPCDAMGAREPMYPVATGDSRELYGRYAAEARSRERVSFAGRLGTFRYLNMDAAVRAALDLAISLVGNK